MSMYTLLAAAVIQCHIGFARWFLCCVLLIRPCSQVMMCTFLLDLRAQSSPWSIVAPRSGASLPKSSWQYTQPKHNSMALALHPLRPSIRADIGRAVPCHSQPRHLAILKHCEQTMLDSSL